MRSKSILVSAVVVICFMLIASTTAKAAVTYYEAIILSDSYSQARGVSNGRQVGQCHDGSEAHATLWSGTAESYVDLHPSGFISSQALDISGGQQVGFGYDGSQGHAILWSGTAESYVDLHPSGFNWSAARGVSNGRQVGNAGYNAIYHAMRWSGTAESYVDLHNVLPSEYEHWGSNAYSIDSAGNIVGTVTQSEHDIDYAVLWQPVPEPPIHHL